MIKATDITAFGGDIEHGTVLLYGEGMNEKLIMIEITKCQAEKLWRDLGAILQSTEYEACK